MTLKDEYPLFRTDCDPEVHRPIFQSANKNFASGFRRFLDLVRRLDERLHQTFALAAYHYARSIKEVGVDPEMVFIRLVSAIETLSQGTKLKQRDDLLEDQSVADLISNSSLSTENKQELKNVFSVRKSRKRFIRFVEEHCSGYFKGGNFKAKHLKIKRADLSETLNGIYGARSRYLHAGEPMYLSVPFRGGERWDTDPTFGMVVDNRSLPASQKLPYAYFFEGLVRHCLLNYLKINSVDPK